MPIDPTTLAGGWQGEVVQRRQCSKEATPPSGPTTRSLASHAERGMSHLRAETGECNSHEGYVLL